MTAPLPQGGGSLSIVIKARNEAAKIAAALRSAQLAAQRLAPMPVEIVLADSCSNDATLAVAADFPVRIVQFLAAAEIGCGAGVELGYQASRGDFVYLMDGDMELDADFLPAALAALQADPGLAGVGGRVVDTAVRNAFDRIRVNNRAVTQAGAAPWLGGGGLFRRTAIDQAGGYAGHPDLLAYEEAELGMRLRAAGWRLQRLDRVAVRHDGHAVGGIELLRRHWRSGRAMAAGVLLRSAWRKPWWRDALHPSRHALLVLGWWLLAAVLLAGWPALLPAWAAASLAGVALHALRKRDARHALFSVLSWHVQLAALFASLARPLGQVPRPIRHRVCQPGGWLS